MKYIDPTGHFTEDQLGEWYGKDWFEVISNVFSAEMASLLQYADFGDMVTFSLDENVYGAIFILGLDKELAMWNVGNKCVTSVEEIDKNPLVGY